MKLIPLTQGKFAMVDDDDFELLNKHKWYAIRDRSVKNYEKFYVRRTVNVGENINPKYFLMHRYICGVTDPKIKIDHKDRNGLNCQKKNLRIANASQNCANRTAFGSSKYLGVSFKNANQKYAVQIMKNKKITHIGYFKSEIDAARAYDEAAIKVHGEFANLNFPIENNSISLPLNLK